MTTYKVHELIGWRLDLAVALAEGAKHWTFDEARGVFVGFDPDPETYQVGHRRELTLPLIRFSPSGDWFDGGPIIERERISLHPPTDTIEWEAVGPATLSVARTGGPTPLVAAMRAFLAARVGHTVELPA